jgi:hypothetical protein
MTLEALRVRPHLIVINASRNKNSYNQTIVPFLRICL